jgi:hypothetical protein
LHLSAKIGSQDMQADPVFPQDENDRGRQVLPVQHPSRQFVGQSLHTPKLHVWLPLHRSQADPLTPQLAAVSLVLGTQVVPEQQPSGQDALVQAHCPFTQSCPTAHAGLAPQRHSWLMQWSDPAELEQAGLLPQRHRPVSQLSAVIGSQRVQTRSLPQLMSEYAVIQETPEQHPIQAPQLASRPPVSHKSTSIS